MTREHWQDLVAEGRLCGASIETKEGREKYRGIVSEAICNSHGVTLKLKDVVCVSNEGRRDEQTAQIGNDTYHYDWGTLVGASYDGWTIRFRALMLGSVRIGLT